MEERSVIRQREKAIQYYDRISLIYDFISNRYYRKARRKAIKELRLGKDRIILNLPCGTGVNFKYFEEYLDNDL